MHLDCRRTPIRSFYFYISPRLRAYVMRVCVSPSLRLPNFLIDNWYESWDNSLSIELHRTMIHVQIWIEEELSLEQFVRLAIADKWFFSSVFTLSSILFIAWHCRHSWAFLADSESSFTKFSLSVALFVVVFYLHDGVFFLLSFFLHSCGTRV